MTDEGFMAPRFDHLVLRPIERGVVEYRCPVCNNRFRTDGDGLEPACTGPSASRDEHPMTPMVKVGVDMERTR